MAISKAFSSGIFSPANFAPVILFIYLFLMGAGGLYSLFPLVFILGNCRPTSVGCLFVFLAIFSPYLSVGLALLINLYINIKACSNSHSKHLDFE
jgi:hypothetical protein